MPEGSWPRRLRLISSLQVSSKFWMRIGDICWQWFQTRLRMLPVRLYGICCRSTKAMLQMLARNGKDCFLIRLMLGGLEGWVPALHLFNPDVRVEWRWFGWYCWWVCIRLTYLSLGYVGQSHQLLALHRRCNLQRYHYEGFTTTKRCLQRLYVSGKLLSWHYHGRDDVPSHLIKMVKDDEVSCWSIAFIGHKSIDQVLEMMVCTTLVLRRLCPIESFTIRGDKCSPLPIWSKIDNPSRSRILGYLGNVCCRIWLPRFHDWWTAILVEFSTGSVQWTKRSLGQQNMRRRSQVADYDQEWLELQKHHQ